MRLTEILIPTTNGPLHATFGKGQTTVFLGANGGGKTRLGVFLEDNIHSAIVHRISAQRALQINSSVALVDLDSATDQLLYGLSLRNNPGLQREQLPQYKRGHRWQGKPATFLINDYEALLQALFADETRESVKFRQAAKNGAPITRAPLTRLDRLQSIWHELLPHRKLTVLETAIKVDPCDGSSQSYDASDLSDGERVILYLIGHALLLPAGSVFIVDEPELHIHRALMTRLWDALESTRLDCAFVYITHDLEFAVSRSAAQKYALLAYFGNPSPTWDIARLSQDSTSLPEEIVCHVVGSRHPILFLEGDVASLDAALYRRVYPTHTVLPVGSCNAVITSVASFRANASLHRLECFGIVDADGRSEAEIEQLRIKNVFVLPVCEAENLLLLPEVFTALAQSLNHDRASADILCAQLSQRILDTAAKDVEAFALRFTKRQIDRRLKAVGLTSHSVDQLTAEFEASMKEIQPADMYQGAVEQLSQAIAHSDVNAVLRLYDNKGMLYEAARLLSMSFRGLEQFVGRTLRVQQGQILLAALQKYLPALDNQAPQVLPTG